MQTHSLFGYIDIFPQYQVHAGRKCLILGDFHKFSNFPMLNGRIVDCVLTSLSSKGIIEHRGMIINFGAWVIGHPEHYGIILPLDFPFEKGCVVQASITVPDLGGV